MSFTLPFPNLTPPGTPAQVEQVVANFAAITSALNSEIFAGFQTVFQATDTTYAGGMSVNNTGAQNVAALQAAVNSALANGGEGGIVYIPAGEYTMTGTVSITGNTVKNGIIIQGSGVGTLLLQTNLTANLFAVTSLSQGNTGGCIFSDLFFRFQASSPQSGATGAAIFIQNAQNVLARRCIFLNCPYGMSDGAAGDTLQCGIDSCQFNNLYMQGGSQVSLSGPVEFVRNSVFLGNGGGTPLSSVAITATGSQIFFISGNQISGFPQGIVLTASSTAGTNQLNQVMITDNFVASDGAAITISPSNASNSKIYDIKISNCTIQHGQGSSTVTAGIIIDSNGQPNTNVQGILISNCMVEGWSNSGLQIGCCSMVTVNGGIYASNGLSPASTAQSANIAISNGSGGVADQIRLVGVYMGGVFSFNGGTSPYAVSLYNGCTDVWILNCDFTGTTNSGQSAVYANAQGGHCFIKECRGYNNINVIVTSNAQGLATTQWFDGTGYGLVPGTGWTFLWFGDYLVTAVATSITACYLSHDRSDVSKELTGLTNNIQMRLNAQQSMRLDFTGAGSAIIFNVFGV